MRSVQVAMSVPEADPAAVFEEVKRFDRYSEIAPAVRSVVRREDADGREVSDWEVHFRNGILRWTEIDDFAEDELSITFAQDDGDFEEFSGRWDISARDGGSRVDFAVSFDFGIPSLAGILEPVAERVIKETITSVVQGLFGESLPADDEAPAVRGS